jgi:hypothetical protein
MDNSNRSNSLVRTARKAYPTNGISTIRVQSEHGDNNKRRREADGTHDIPLVELALEVVDDVGAGCEVGRHEDVGPVPRPPGVVLVVVRLCPDPLQPLRISRSAAGARVRLPSHVRSAPRLDPRDRERERQRRLDCSRNFS